MKRQELSILVVLILLGISLFSLMYLTQKKNSDDLIKNDIQKKEEVSEDKNDKEDKENNKKQNEDIPLISFKDLAVIYPSSVKPFPTSIKVYNVKVKPDEGISVLLWTEKSCVLEVGGPRGYQIIEASKEDFPLDLSNLDETKNKDYRLYYIPRPDSYDRLLWHESTIEYDDFYTFLMTRDEKNNPKELLKVESNVIPKFAFSKKDAFYSYDLFTDDKNLMSTVEAYSFKDNKTRVIRKENAILTEDDRLKGRFIRNCGGNNGMVYYDLMELDNDLVTTIKPVTVFRYDLDKEESAPIFMYERPFDIISGQDGIFFGQAQTGERVIIDIKKLKGYSIPTLKPLGWSDTYETVSGDKGFYFNGGSNITFIDPNTFTPYINDPSSVGAKFQDYQMAKYWLWKGGYGVNMYRKGNQEDVIIVELENTINLKN